ncbi:MAG: hypothetical protein PUC99_07610 [Eubacteriales bacterium]|jgi:uncharacterized membrane protein|nr:hypothetical protein [Lachnospiraceae bacterium]MDD5860186.1 hypothetical protein [Eubacteriales bacterium]MCI1334488.1 hypothetical protein [Lachnospiraceae bacterium]MCI1358741.1 hypothetical protein [Lachnospiraceae bacterium]MCI1379363.1 hypothetical protein [Lachnospiraceae bacterium]
MKRHVSILLSIILWLMTAILFVHIVPQHVSDPATSFLFLFLAIGAVSCTAEAVLERRQSYNTNRFVTNIFFKG